MARGFLFRVPERCRKCQELGAVSLEHTLKGQVATITWCCRACGEEWPVTPSDHIERRAANKDRRRSSRTDRRKR